MGLYAESFFFFLGAWRRTPEHRSPPILVICFLASRVQVAQYGCAPLAVVCVLVHLPD